MAYEWCGLSARRRNPRSPRLVSEVPAFSLPPEVKLGFSPPAFVSFPILEWVCNVLTLVKQERSNTLSLRKEDMSSRYVCVSEKDLRATLMCEELGGRRNKILFLFLLFQEALCVLSFPFVRLEKYEQGYFDITFGYGIVLLLHTWTTWFIPTCEPWMQKPSLTIHVALTNKSLLI